MAGSLTRTARLVFQLALLVDPVAIVFNLAAAQGKKGVVRSGLEQAGAIHEG